MTTAYCHKSYDSWKFKKAVKFHVPKYPFFAGLVTNVDCKKQHIDMVLLHDDEELEDKRNNKAYNRRNPKKRISLVSFRVSLVSCSKSAKS